MPTRRDGMQRMQSVARYGHALQPLSRIEHTAVSSSFRLAWNYISCRGQKQEVREHNTRQVTPVSEFFGTLANYDYDHA